MNRLALGVGILAIGMGGYFNSRPKQLHPPPYPNPPEAMEYRDFGTHKCTVFYMENLLLTADHCIKTNGKIYDAESDVGILDISFLNPGFRQASVEELSKAKEVIYFDKHNGWKEKKAKLQRSIPKNTTFFQLTNLSSRPGNSGSPSFIKVNDQYVVIGVLSAFKRGASSTVSTVISLLPENFKQNIDLLVDRIPGTTKIVNSDDGEINTFENWTQTQNDTQRADKRTITHPKGENETYENWILKNGDKRADKVTIQYPNNKTQTHENWILKNGDLSSDKFTIKYPNGEIRTLKNWTETQNGDQRADILIIEYPNGEIHTFENWTRTQNRDQRADILIIEYPNGEIRTHKNWTQTQNGDHRADKLT